MPLATLRQLLDEAASGGYAVGAFKVSNMEQAGRAGDFTPMSLDAVRVLYSS